jgi:DNA-binding NarL/FixJ family response regulator
MVGQLLGEAVELKVFAYAEDARVLIDPGYIEQVLLNLAVNASEAMPEGGVVTITTRGRDLDEHEAAELDVPAGPHVVLAVTDRGEGMDAATKSKIFEPFFTTKATGSGLGLSTVYGIVRQCGGLIRVDSQPGEGSTFEVWLPHEQGGDAREWARLPEHDTRGTGVGTVLLAEDEPLVRELAVAVLERSGYRVLSAATGEEALMVFERNQDAIDVLVADMVMPGMGGRELAERVLARRPQAPVVLMSGYTEDPPVIDREGIREPLFPHFLQKPFAPSALVERVAVSIEGSQESDHDAPLEGRSIATCLVADDHPAVLDSVSSYLHQNRFEVVARASRGDDALALIAREQPAIALLDVRMAALTGIEVARRASQVAPKTRIALFTGYGDRGMLEQALDAGARAFILKEAPLPELLRALTIVATGGTYVDPELAGTLASGQTAEALSPITKREQQVLGLVADGMTNDKVAEALGISPETVQSHVRNAMAKLDADTRTQAVATAFRRSLLA